MWRLTSFDKSMNQCSVADQEHHSFAFFQGKAKYMR
jgi:hypothetical protein